jgi:hypothetical protein
MCPVAAAEQREAAFGGEAVVNSGNAVFQVNRVHRIDEDCVLERSLAGSAAATTVNLYIAISQNHSA